MTVDRENECRDPVDTVVLLTVDAFGAAHAGFLGYERATTPRLSVLLDRNASSEAPLPGEVPTAWFGDCVAQSSHTRESMPSLFFSAYPFSLGDVGPVPTDRPTLATVASGAGVATAGFHSNPYLSRAYGFDRGFDAFGDALPLGRNRLGVLAHRLVNHLRMRPYTRAGALNERGLDWLDATPAPRLLWLHYMDPHGPYQPPERHQRAFRSDPVGARRAKRLWRTSVDEPETLTDDDRRALVDLHDAEIRFADAAIADLLADLERRDPGLSETLVVVAADHGDLFGEHGQYGHPRRLYEELVHVPLVLVGGPVAPGRREETVENVDVAPTLLDALGLAPEPAFAGDSLLRTAVEGGSGEPAGSERPDEPAAAVEPPREDSGLAFAEAHGEGADADVERYAVRNRRFKFTLERRPDGTEKVLYDLDGAGEPVDVAGEFPDAARELRERLRIHVEAAAAEGATVEAAPDGDVDAAVADRLEKLGYR
jgi:arylsulfatase